MTERQAKQRTMAEFGFGIHYYTLYIHGQDVVYKLVPFQRPRLWSCKSNDWVQSAFTEGEIRERARRITIPSKLTALMTADPDKTK